MPILIAAGGHVGEDRLDLRLHDSRLDTLDGGDLVGVLRCHARDGAGAVNAVRGGALEVDLDARSGAAVRCGNDEYGVVHGNPFQPRITGTVLSVANNFASQPHLVAQLPIGVR